jgi:hypothetical protein
VIVGSSQSLEERLSVQETTEVNGPTAVMSYVDEIVTNALLELGGLSCGCGGVAKVSSYAEARTSSSTYLSIANVRPQRLHEHICRHNWNIAMCAFFYARFLNFPSTQCTLFFSPANMSEARNLVTRWSAGSQTNDRREIM